MPTYRVTDPASGKTVKLTGDSPPTEEELNGIFASLGGGAEQPTEQVQTPQEEPVPQWGRENPNLYGAYGAAKETGKAIAKPVAQAGAMAGGFMLGGPPGAALAYGIEQQGEKLLEEKLGEREPVPLMQRMGEASQDVAVGLAGEALGPALQAGGKAFSAATKPLQKYFYESALKIPPSVPKALRDVAVEKGIQGHYVPSPKGLEKLKTDIKDINRQIADVIDIGTQSGKTVDTSKVLTRLDDLRAFYKNTPDPTDYLAQIDDIANNMKSYHGDHIPLKKAQEIKQTIYRLEKKHYGEMKGLQIEANKTIARGLKEEILKNEPSLAKLNADDSAMLNLESVLERAVNRIRNYDVIRWGDTFMTLTGAVVGGTGGAVGAGLTKRLLEDAAIKSRIAFALSKASKIKPRPAATRAGVLAVAEEARDED
jgi:hypothetical protein